MKLDGKELASSIRGFQLSMDTEGRQLVLYALPYNDVNVYADVDVVHLFMPPRASDALKLAVEYLTELDPKEIEAIALDRLQWGGPQNMSHLTLAVIIEVLLNASNESGTDQEVPRSPDDGHDQGDTARAD